MKQYYLAIVVIWSLWLPTYGQSDIQATLNDVQLSQSGEVLWVSDNAHTDVRGVSMINGTETIFLPHQSMPHKVYEDEDQIITIGKKIRFWAKPTFILTDSISFEAPLYSFQIISEFQPATNQLVVLEEGHLMTINTVSKQMTRITLPDQFSPKKLAISKDGKFLLANSVNKVIKIRLGGTNIPPMELINSKQTIHGLSIGNQQFHLLVSENAYMVNQNPKIESYNLDGHLTNSIEIEELYQLKLSGGQTVLNFHLGSNAMFSAFNDQLFLVETTDGIMIINKEEKQKLVSNLEWSNYTTPSKFYFQNGKFIRSVGSQITVLDTRGNIHFEYDLLDLQTSFEKGNEEYAVLITPLSLNSMNLETEENISQTFDWNNYLLPLSVTHKQSLYTFHRPSLVRQWNTETLEKQASWKFTGNRVPLNLTKNAKYPNRWFCTFSDDSLIYEYESSNGEILNTITPFDQGNPVSLISDAEHLYIGSSWGSISKYELATLSKVKQENVFGNAISAIETIEKTDQLLVASKGRFTQINNDLTDLDQLEVMLGHENYITHVDLTTFKDKPYLLTTSSMEGAAYIWDLDNQSLARSIPRQSKNIQKSTFLDSMKLFMAVDSLGFVFDDQWELREKLLQRIPEVGYQKPPSSTIAKIEFSPDQNYMLCLMRATNQAQVWDMHTLKLIGTYGSDLEYFNDAVFSKNSKSLIINSGTKLVFYDINTGSKSKTIDYSHAGSASIHKLVSHPTLPLVLGINTHGWHTPFVINVNSGLNISSLYLPLTGHLIYDMQFSETGKYLGVHTNKEVVVFENYMDPKPAEVYRYERASEKSYTSGQFVQVYEKEQIVVFVDSDDGIRTHIVDFANNKEIASVQAWVSTLGAKEELVYSNLEEPLRLDITSLETSKFSFKRRFLQNISNLNFNAKFGLYVIGDTWGNLKIIDKRSGEAFLETDRFQNDIYNFELSSNKALFTQKQGMYLFDVHNFEHQKIESADNYPWRGAVSTTGDSIIHLQNQTDHAILCLYNSLTKKSTQLIDLKIDKEKLNHFYLQDQKIIFSIDKIDDKRIFGYYDLATDQLVENIYEGELISLSKYHDKQGSYYYKTTLDKKSNEVEVGLFYLNLQNGKSTKQLHSFSIPLGGIRSNQETIISYLKLLHVNPKNKLMLYNTEEGVQLFDFSKKRFVFQNLKDFDYEYAILRNDKEEILFITDQHNLISYNLSNQKTTQLLSIGESADQLSLNEDNLYLLTKSEELLVVNANNGNILRTIHAANDAGVTVFNPDGYYYSQKESVSNITYKDGLKAYPYSQFDAWYNRPDILLSESGYENTDQIELYKKAWEKRIKKLEIQTDVPKLDEIPTAYIDKTNIPVSTNLSSIDFHIEGKSPERSKDNISSYNIWVNGVPLYGSKGQRLKMPSRTIDKVVSVPLSSGRNKVEFSITTENKISSLKEMCIINTTAQPAESTLFVVGIGISKFEQAEMNLSYADKDAKDIIADFSSNYSSSQINVVPILLLNEQVTISNILDLKKQLSKSNVNDKVILFYAGHGVLDDELNYYLSTHKMDFKDPKNGGLLFDEFVSILDGIPARQKLILADACHSGELDLEPPIFSNNSVKETINFRGVNNGTSISTTNSFELMQRIFSELRGETGASIISSAGGNEYAYEEDRWKNGVFTYAVRKAFADFSADQNKDEKITVSELLTHVSIQVERLTEGKQRPTSRRYNQDEDFTVWQK